MIDSGSEPMTAETASPRQIPSNVILIDFSPLDIMQSILKNDHLDESILISQYGEGFRLSPQFFADHPKLSLLYSYVKLYENHADNVLSVMSDTWKKLGLKSSVSIYPVQTSLKLKNVELTSDELNNKTIFFNFDTGMIIQAFKKYPDKKIVNLSIQIGKIEVCLKEFIKIPLAGESGEGLREQVVRDGFPCLAINGSYTREKAPESLKELYKIARAIPEKLIFAAGGDHNDDSREAIKQLSVPPNLIIIGQWGSQLHGENYPTRSVFGADIYVENSKLKIDDSSSLSASFVSAHASTLLDKGYTLGEVKEKILAACEIRTFIDNDGVENQARVFNPELLISEP